MNRTAFVFTPIGPERYPGNDTCLEVGISEAFSWLSDKSTGCDSQGLGGARNMRKKKKKKYALTSR